MKTGVLGLGLIGGSIFKRLREIKKYNVIGVSRTVRESGVFENYEVLKDCGLVFVCSPMNKTLEVLDRLNGILDKNTIVSDVCSLKKFVCEKDYEFKFIPSHPMAGTERSGWENSFSGLFNNAVWAITPKAGTEQEDLEILKTIISDIGARAVITTPEEHDRAAALISHMPMLAAQGLCKNIENNELAKTLAASGFRDMTRLALSNTEMANDMMRMNMENIKEAVNLLLENMEELLRGDYKEEAERIKNFRDRLYPSSSAK